MLARLLLVLLIAILPMPAAASCHAAPAMTAHHGMKHEPAKQLPADQLCIGCVAPATARVPDLVRPLAFARVKASPAYLPGAPRSSTPPATPPPRSAA